MAHTFSESVAIVKQAADLAYAEVLEVAKKGAAEYPDDASRLSFYYDVAVHMGQIRYWAGEADREAVIRGGGVSNITLGSLIFSVADSDADAEAVSRYLVDWVTRYENDGHYEEVVLDRIAAWREHDIPSGKA